MESAASASVAGQGVHSSSTMAMLLSSRCWIAMQPAGVSWWREPSVWARKVTPSSWMVRSWASDITWKPPESVRMGPGQFMNVCRAAEAGDAVCAGADHQMIGVAEHDLGPARPHGIDREPLDRRLRSHRHEGGCVHGPVCGLQPAEPGTAVRRLHGEAEAHDASPRASRQASP